MTILLKGIKARSSTFVIQVMIDYAQGAHLSGGVRDRSLIVSRHKIHD